VNRVVADAEVEHGGLCDGCADCGRRAARRPLAQEIREAAARPEPLTAAELEDNYACFATEDFNIGYRSFLEKKKPEFKGR
jgi:enoyl-CoA hydratase